MIAIRWMAGFLLVAACGCAESDDKSAMVESTSSYAYRNTMTPTSEPPADYMQVAGQMAGGAPGSISQGSGRENLARAADPMADGAAEVTADAVIKSPARKIIYTADVVVTVDDFPTAAEEIQSLVTSHDGFVADSDVSGTVGVNRHATWKLRIPIDRFAAFLKSISALGELQRKQIHSQDITEEYFDLEARIKNKRVEEARLVQLLTESTGKLEEILSVERRIAQVREEIERMEGRVRLLSNLSELTTITVVLDERVKFVPATNPGFATKISHTFTQSSSGFLDFLAGMALAAVAIVPWLPLWLIVFLIAWIVVRLLRRRLVRIWTATPGTKPA